jgi:hypothetical protein
MTNLSLYDPRTGVYAGTDLGETVSTYDLSRSYPGSTGFRVNGNNGNDILMAYIYGDIRADYLNGGDGDDFLAADSYLTSFANVAAVGGLGHDEFYLPGVRDMPRFSVSEMLIKFSVNSSRDNSPLDVVLGKDVELIRYQDSLGRDAFFLTEDIAHGRIRRVSAREAYWRTSGENADWAVKGLDTYTSYHQITGKAAAITSSIPGVFCEGATLVAGGVTGDPSGMPVNPGYSYQWFRNNVMITDATARTYDVPVGASGVYRVSVSYTDAQGFRGTVNSPA